jgi:L-malate glycosyltransferase
MSKLKIAVTINYLAIGGSQSFALALARGLSARGHEVFVYDFNLPYFTNSLETLNSPLLHPGAFTYERHTVSLPLYKQLSRFRLMEVGLKWLTNGSRVRRFRKFLLKNKIDIVSSHLMGADTLSSLAVQNEPAILHCATMHGSYEGFQRLTKKKIRDIVFARVNGVIYLTKKNIEFLNYLPNRNPKMKIRQIYNGYIPGLFDTQDLTREEVNLPASAFVFIQVARGTANKGWQQTIDAFLIARKTNPQIVLLLVGDGEHLTELRKKYAAYKDIIFYGYSGNPIPLIKLADAGLLPTYYPGESLPNTVIEYLFLGKPVLASDIGEIKNMIGSDSPDAAGFTFPFTPAGTVDEKELAEKMIAYSARGELYTTHARNTARQSEKFRMENCAAAYEAFFRELT